MKILFISNDAHQGGAQILLLNLTKALQGTQKFEIEFLLKRGGPLLAEFEALSQTYLLTLLKQRKTLKRQFKSILLNTSIDDMNVLKWSEYDSIISNTITNGDILDEIRKYYQGPLISYIHELKLSAQTFSNNLDISNVIRLSDHFLVPCNSVTNFLKNSFHVPDEKITVLPYYFPLQKKNDDSNKKRKQKFIVGAAGTTDWRKGPDIFIQIAARIKNIEPEADIKFIWKGSNTDSLQHLKLQYDVDKLNLNDMISFEMPENELDSFFEEVDVFLLTSREDPYPLVVLQAANHSIPTICFKDAGGIPEFITNSKGGGVNINYLDIHKAAEAILYYYKNPHARNEAGELAKEYLFQKHQNILDFSACLSQVIEEKTIQQ